MKKRYIQAIIEKGYHQEWENDPGILTRRQGDECYIIMVGNFISSVEKLTQKRLQMDAHYREAGYSHVYQLVIVFQETAMFSDELIQMTNQISNLWLFAEDQNRMYQYENQPLEFDGICAALESLPVVRTSIGVPVPFNKKSAPWVTWGLVVVNVLLFLIPILLNQYDTWVEFGMNQYNYVLEQGQVYRLFTAMFLHGSLSHLMNNMVVLLVLGFYLEPVLGHIQYSAIYVLSGIAGNLCSIFFRMSEIGSIGASGAIFGLSGAMLALVLFYKGRIPGLSTRRVIYMCVVSLYGGFTTVNVDNAAHVGGLIYGFLLVIITNIFHEKCT